MKNTLLLALCCLIGFIIQAQVVQWNFSSKKIADKTYEIHLTATVEEDWHIYSQATPKGGPLATQIIVTKNPLISLAGKFIEIGRMKIYHDDAFDVDVYAYTGTVDFVQIVKLKGNPSKSLRTKVNGTVEFMACTKERCLVPEKRSFSISIQ